MGARQRQRPVRDECVGRRRVEAEGPDGRVRWRQVCGELGDGEDEEAGQGEDGEEGSVCPRRRAVSVSGGSRFRWGYGVLCFLVNLQGESGYPPASACGAIPSKVSRLEWLW